MTELNTTELAWPVLMTEAEIDAAVLAEPSLCYGCSGSGEGQNDGSICQHCRGSGEQIQGE